jgi:REP element-mobilizing transposase RayT
MPRIARTVQPGLVYHLIARFIDHEWFIRTADERALYLSLMGRALQRCDWMLLAYAIMSNHIHLCVVAGRQTLASWIRRVHSPFADALNRAYERIGCMFVRGPKSYVVPTERVGNVIAYIHNNPVRAGVCATAADSDWTSHRAFVGMAKPPRWLHVGEGLARARMQDRRDFDAFVNAPERAALEEQFDEETYELALTARNHVLTQAEVAAREAQAAAVVAATAEILRVPVTQLRSRARGPIEQLGRAAAVHCAAGLGLSGVETARSLAMSQQGVSVIRRRALNTNVAQLSQSITTRLGSGHA